LGSGSVVFDSKDIKADSEIDEESSVEQRHRRLFRLKEDVKQGMKSEHEEIRQLTEAIRIKFTDKFDHKFTDDMKKQFEAKFHSQSKLKEMTLDKLKKMKPIEYRF
jgi:hypothetical protein